MLCELLVSQPLSQRGASMWRERDWVCSESRSLVVVISVK
jgi:hypothetical protein